MDVEVQDQVQEQAQPLPPPDPAESRRSYQKLVAMEAGNHAPGAIIPQNVGEIIVLAGAIHASGMAPNTLNSPDKITVALMEGLELGLPPMQALKNIAVINGRAGIWGDLGLAMIYRSGMLEDHQEGWEGEGDARKAWCQMTRSRGPRLTMRKEFSVEDAKRATLWGGQRVPAGAKRDASPWVVDPDTMLLWRARWRLFRALFSDVLRNMPAAEELRDMEPIDVTPNTGAPDKPAGKPREDIAARLAAGNRPVVTTVDGAPVSGRAEDGDATPAPKTATSGPQAAENGSVATSAGEATNPSPAQATAEGAGIGAGPVPGDMFERTLVEELRTALSGVESRAQFMAVDEEFAGAMALATEETQVLMREELALVEARFPAS